MWFILLLIINCIVAKTISYECKTNENCSNVIRNSICINNKCVYRLRSRRQINFGVRMLGEECQSNDECRRTPVDGTKVCLLSQCQCSNGHVPIDAYRCIRDFEQFSSNTRVTKSYEIDEIPGYGSICSTNKDCQQSTIQLECIRGMCVCLEGYVPLGKYLCYNIRGQDAPSMESSTRTTTTTSTFDPPNNEMTKSLGKLGNRCTNDYYCRRSVSQSHCLNGKCSCIDGYISHDLYTCILDTNKDLTTISYNSKSLLGGKCLTNQNCHTSDAKCLNNICTCPNGYFPIDDWNCLQELDSSDEELTVTTTTKLISIKTTTGILWWPWSPTSTTPATYQSLVDLKNTFRFRCLLNRQCISVDSNSHCTLFGRCVCNIGYKLEMTDRGQTCVRQIINDDNCD